MNQIGVIQGLEHKIGVWSDRLTKTESDLAAQEAIIAASFAKQAELDAKTSRFNEVMSILNPKDEQVIGDEGDVQYQARKYWIPNLSKAEWALLNNRAEIEMSNNSNYLDESTKWLYAKEKGAEVFALYGIGDGTVPTVLYASGRAKASTDYEQFTSFVKEFKHGTVAYAETTYRWSEIISSVYGAKYGDYDAHGHRRKKVELNEILAEASKRIGRGNSRGSAENSNDVTQHQQRTSPLTDREVLSIAASEVNVEGLTDGGRDARAGAAAALFCSPPPYLSPDYAYKKCHGQYFYLISIISVPTTMSARPNAAFLLKCSLNTNAEKPMETRILSLSMGTTTLARPSCNAL